MNAVAIDLKDFLTIAAPDPNEPAEIPWPCEGVEYVVEFQVEHIGPWIDNPSYTLVESHDDLGWIFAEHGWDLVCHEDELPIASGLYRATFTYWCNHRRDYWTGEDDSDYGFNIANLQRVRNLTAEEILGEEPCSSCNDNGVVGWPPDGYFACPECTPS